MASRRNSQAEEDQLLFEQQLMALQRRLAELRIGITRINRNDADMQSSILKDQIQLMGITLKKIGDGFRTHLELSNPFGLSIVVQAMRVALKSLFNIMKLVPHVRDAVGDEILSDVNFLLCVNPRVGPDSD